MAPAITTHQCWIQPHNVPHQYSYFQQHSQPQPYDVGVLNKAFWCQLPNERGDAVYTPPPRPSRTQHLTNNTMLPRVWYTPFPTVLVILCGAFSRLLLHHHRASAEHADLTKFSTICVVSKMPNVRMVALCPPPAGGTALIPVGAFYHFYQFTASLFRLCAQTPTAERVILR